MVLAIIKKDQSQSAYTWILANRIAEFGHVIKTNWILCNHDIDLYIGQWEDNHNTESRSFIQYSSLVEYYVKIQ